MPRYKLRTLLIVLALGPPMLAGAWTYFAVFREAFSTFTSRDGLWLVLLTGLAIGFWTHHRRSERRIAALAKKIVRIREQEASCSVSESATCRRSYWRLLEDADE